MLTLTGREVICMCADKVIDLLILELKLYLSGHECAADSIYRYRKGVAK
jgi:hypothetical protein